MQRVRLRPAQGAVAPELIATTRPTKDAARSSRRRADSVLRSRPFAPRATAAMRKALLAHYDAHRRVLPWRGDADPYRIWISEVMLQQTRVETVTRRWAPFLGEFPDLLALARADDDRLMKAWEGLGYYARARNLKRAAQAMVERHAGRLPDDHRALLDLPGFGGYTAAAVASIAFARPHAVLDGNVVRVLARLLDDDRDSTDGGVRDDLQRAAQDLLAPERPGDWNQAVMDLGATVCVPKRPRCLLCPLARHCRGRASGRAETLPRRPPRRALPHVDVALGLVRRGNALLVGRRPKEGLLGGLWEFPGGKLLPGESLEAACRREVREETGLSVETTGPALVVDHAYSHFRVTLHAFPCRVLRGRLRARGCTDLRFVPIGDLGRYAFPAANRRLLESYAVGGRPSLTADPASG